MLFGLSIGLVVAAGVYIADRSQLAAPGSITSVAEPPALTVTVEPLPEPQAETPPNPAARFEFFDILPNFEVVLPEVEADAIPDSEPVSVADPGSYVLQAGSFMAPADAETRRANLALLGVESRLQRVSIDDDVYHRVRIGPTSDLNELNTIRRRLRNAEIDVLLIKLPN
jgi:cell division protein FtsN